MLDFFTKKQDSLQKENTIPVLPQELYSDTGLNLADVIAPSAVKVNSKHLNLGEKVVRSFFVTSYPSVLSDNWLTPLINLDKMFDVGLYLSIYADSEGELARTESEIKSMMESRLIYLRPALFQQETAFQ